MEMADRLVVCAAGAVMGVVEFMAGRVRLTYDDAWHGPHLPEPCPGARTTYCAYLDRDLRRRYRPRRRALRPRSEYGANLPDPSGRSLPSVGHRAQRQVPERRWPVCF